MSTEAMQPEECPQSAPLDDAAERMRALDTTRSILVNASAGSGKTELLIQRYLKLLAQAEDPEEILAITFTRKAAAEMLDRILSELRSAESANPGDPLSPHKEYTRTLALAALENSTARGWNLTRQPHRMQLRTIDSLCANITQRIPILAQIGADARTVEDAQPLYQAAAHAALSHALQPQGSLTAAARTLLLHLDNRFATARKLLADLLASRDQWGHIFPVAQEFSSDRMDAILHERFAVHFERHVQNVYQRIQDALNKQNAQTIFSLMQHAARNLSADPDQNNPYVDCLSWNKFPDATPDHADSWKLIAQFLFTNEGALRAPRGITKNQGFPPKDPRKKEMLQLLAQLADNPMLVDALCAVRSCPSPGYSEQQKNVLLSSFLLLRSALVELQLVFARTGQTDFTQVMLAARNALQQDASGAALALGTKIQHLLVDEVQDTSVTQFQLLQALTQSWDGHSQTVFLVGDPKQSIYRFRNAEVALFAQAQRYGLGSIRFELITLSKNFRSEHKLVEAGNDWFAQIFAYPNEQDAISFTPALAVRNGSAQGQIQWHPRIQSTNAEPAQSSDALEAQEICLLIRQVQKEKQAGCKPKSIAILVRKRAQAIPILAALREQGIGYHTVDMDTLADRQPLLDLLALTRALLHAADRTAWLAVLRAPWCGLTLADLHILCGADDEKFRDSTVSELLQDRIHLLSNDGQIRAQRTWTALQLAQALVAHEPLSVLVERLWNTLGGPACIQPQDSPTIDQFFDLLNALAAEPTPISGVRIEEQMQKLYAQPLTLPENPVEILTIHKAKGLEWDVVFLPGLHKKVPPAKTKLLLWSEEWPLDASAEPRIYLAPIQHATEKDEPTSAWLRQRIRARDAAEMCRLFYVACTRARDQLHLFAEAKLSRDGNLTAPNQDSLLSVTWPFAETIFTDASAHKDAPGKLLEMPTPSAEDRGNLLSSLAAHGEPASIPLSNFRRLPADWHPEWPQMDSPPSNAVLQPQSLESAEDTSPLRPQGSLHARNFGTVLHALLQPLATILRGDQNADAQQAAIAKLQQPAKLRLRQSGTTPKEAKMSAEKIQRTCESLAHDPIAQWILAAQPSINSALPEFEIPFTAMQQNQAISVRLDRMFLAGPEPGATGISHLWIVDFKTSDHGAHGLEEFLAEQKEIYKPTMQRYANAVRAAYPQAPAIHLALYYPLLLRCTWWAAEEN